MKSLLTICLFLTTFTYSSVVGFEFLKFDDQNNILKNKLVTETTNPLTLFTTTNVRDYFPITTLSFLIQRVVFGLDAGVFHLINLLLFLLSGVCLWLWLRELFPSSWLLQLTPICIYLFHPAQIETVAWISEQKNTLSSIFIFLSLYFYTKEMPSSLGVCLSFVLGLLSKAVAVFVLPVFLFVDLLKGGSLKSKAGLKLGLLFVGTSFFIFRISLLKAPDFSLNEIFQGVFSSLTFYVSRSLFPRDMVGYFEINTVVFDKLDFVLLIVFLSSILAVYRDSGRLKIWLLSMGIFFSFIAPFLFLTNSGLAHIYGSRYLQIPLVGVGILFGLILEKISYPKWQGVILAVVSILLMTGTWMELPNWENDTKLWTRVLQVYPKSAMAHFNLGKLAEDAGNITEARNHFQQSYSIMPISGAMAALGRVSWKLGEKKEAKEWLERAAKYDVTDSTLLNLGMIEFEDKNYAQAAEYFKESLKQYPNELEAREYLEKCYALLKLESK